MWNLISRFLGEKMGMILGFHLPLLTAGNESRVVRRGKSFCRSWDAAGERNPVAVGLWRGTAAADFEDVTVSPESEDKALSGPGRDVMQGSAAGNPPYGLW